ncbi:MAG: hypothetical protein A3J38_08725 [Gammaproteobacteria bacterium RIFCSPHIGHO2_12_FULL_45_9]|nr:MAG: hypothetical protein A3J38_08725 [Gammaproteobacteria bacterium RIFCSPHIGHO2_12_FULL_45_9]
MSNASLQEQLQAVASQLSDKLVKTAASGSKKPTARKAFPKEGPASKVSQSHSGQARLERPAAPSTKKPKPKWLDYVHYGVELLRAYFPKAFKPVSGVVPLKKGIKQDLVKQLSTLENVVMEDKACMVKSLSYYVNTLAYHKSVVTGATRIDLAGHAAGLVTAEEATYSVERLEAKLQAKKTSTPPLPTRPVEASS